MTDFKTEIKESLQTEIDNNTFIMDIITRFKDTIRQSIVNPGIDTTVIMDVFPPTIIPATETDPEQSIFGDPLTTQQITQIQMACIKHIGVPVEVTPYQLVVFMTNFLK
jgi:hypothetical protein